MVNGELLKTVFDSWLSSCLFQATLTVNVSEGEKSQAKQDN